MRDPAGQPQLVPLRTILVLVFVVATVVAMRCGLFRGRAGSPLAGQAVADPTGWLVAAAVLLPAL